MMRMRHVPINTHHYFESNSVANRICMSNRMRRSVSGPGGGRKIQRSRSYVVETQDVRKSSQTQTHTHKVSLW